MISAQISNDLVLCRWVNTKLKIATGGTHRYFTIHNRLARQSAQAQ
ncbi:MAG: hypothetical protein N838_21125 [Thiohalocapsa sp. PB-PSB1]|nr:MAG: hypothetical protein N838_21125 [Thiohalocapsa sp. PB-PSB1]